MQHTFRIHSQSLTPPSPPLYNNTTSCNPLPRFLSALRHPHHSIASRWLDLHGRTAWSGLINPLDPDLRCQLLRYGDFIHSIYHAFLNSSSSSPAAHHLSDNSYRITRHLFATSSLIPPPFLPSSIFPRSAFIGFVAVCDTDAEIRRMGRRDIVIALRGTSTWLEWAENLRAHLVPFDSGQSKVACGLRSLYTTAGATAPSLGAAVAEEIRRLIMRYDGEEMSITVTGHSLGAALAILVAGDLIAGESGKAMPPIAVFSFGGPKVGNRAFVERLEEARGLKVLRVVNARDFVTWMPASIGEGYEHVGRELRVESKVSPFLKPDADPACCHDLEAYLHLVDVLGGGSGGSLFRRNASLARLLRQQRGNVKKFYVSKFRELGMDLARDGGHASLLRLPELI